MSEQDEVIQEFLVESYEGLDQLDQELVALEDDPGSTARLASIFRTIHSLKGTSGFLGFSKLEAIAHVGENLLSKLRDGHMTFERSIADALLTMVDAIRKILASLEATETEGDGDYQQVVTLLAELASPRPRADGPTEKVEDTAPKAAEPDSDEAPSLAPSSPEPSPISSRKDGPSATPHEAEDSGPGEALRTSVAPESLLAAPAPQATTPTEASTQSIPSAPSKPQSLPPPQLNADHRGGVTDANIRVDVGLLDRLMNLVGELVLARNQILQFSAAADDAAFVATTQRLNLITTELQEGLMKTRMQAIGSVWTKFPRVIRDLARLCGKNVKLEMDGAETELDRTVIEAIKDPLTHIIRNSVDHGIEAPDERRRRGKPEMGRLSLRAFHESGKVNIEISDDGKGLDLPRIRQKAVQKGIVTQEHAERMSDKEAMQLIFAPGFSTAQQVTQVSGRGVGMDVVKTNIEKIGGSVELLSRPNAGTTLKIKIPLTLAIIPALVVACSGDSYAIPQVNLLELVRLEREVARSAIEFVHDAPVYRLRGNLLPLVYLNRVLGVERRDLDLDAVNIVVLQADDKQFGLVVDRVSDTEEIVVKPLGKELKGVGIYAGATIMGDGRVALILDVPGVAQAGRLAASERDRRIRHVGTLDRSRSKRETLLVFRINERERVAVPLRTIARLEEVEATRVERAGGDSVVQYRGEIMPLLRLDEALGRDRMAPQELLQVLVFSERGRSVGLIVEAIEDVVDQDLGVRRDVDRPGIIGEAVVQDRVTELLDVREVVRSKVPDFFRSDAAE